MDEIKESIDSIKQPQFKETILAAAMLVKGIVEGTMCQDEFYKDDDVTPKTPTNKAIQLHLDTLNNNLNFVKNNEKYLNDVALDENESDLINFSNSETVSTFLEQGNSNWANHGGETNGLFFNLQLNVSRDMFIFSFTVDNTSIDYADYAELHINNNGNLSVYSYGIPKDNNRIRSPINLNYGPNDFMFGTKLTVVVYSANRESASIDYN